MSKLMLNVLDGPGGGGNRGASWLLSEPVRNLFHQKEREKARFLTALTVGVCESGVLSGRHTPS